MACAWLCAVAVLLNQLRGWAGSHQLVQFRGGAAGDGLGAGGGTGARSRCPALREVRARRCPGPGRRTTASSAPPAPAGLVALAAVTPDDRGDPLHLRDH
ncbi:hypothetical protein HBB16_15820 [Pseudonocardia sp. MCCB 268]|nr:hypothetical protein [Pseudonocardia cytotoxica]